MKRPAFEDLPFYERPDLTSYLIHLTKNTKKEDGYSAYDNLISILEKGKIWGSSRKSGFIKGPNKAVCFMDVPFVSLKYVLNKDNTDPSRPRYEPFGVFITKEFAYKRGVRPVLYLSDAELRQLRIPREEYWRVVRFEPKGEGWISWMHEREWRSQGNLELPKKIVGVLVKDLKTAMKLQDSLKKGQNKFCTLPKTILPLSVVCQGLKYLNES